MNGELFQICKLTAGAKKALAQGGEFLFAPGQYENKIEFQFLSMNPLAAQEAESVYRPADWFAKCKQQEVVDMKMMIPLKAENRKVLGFANTSRASILTFLKNGEVHYWIARWEFDSKLRLWNIVYKEAVWENAPQGRPQFADNTKEFLAVLGQIGEFANKIGAHHFGKIFREAAAILRKEMQAKVVSELPLPEAYRHIFEAAARADVFGAMGSWNDDPASMAQSKGLFEQYDRLSDELLKQIRQAVLFAVNQW